MEIKAERCDVNFWRPWEGEIIHLVKVLATKADELNVVFENHKLEEEN